MKRPRSRAAGHHRDSSGDAVPSPGPSLRGRRSVDGKDSAPTELLTDGQRHKLAGLATPVRLTARKLLYHEHSPAKWIFICGEGVLKAFRELPSGKRRIAAFLFPGDICGLSEDGRYVNAIRTVTAATLYRIKVEDLTDALRHDPDLSLQILYKVTQELREAQRRAIIIGRRDATGRFAMFLVMLENHAPPAARSQIVRIPMSRSDIADYLGLSLEALSRATSRLTRDGVIDFQDRHTVRVRDRAALARLAAEV